MKPGELNRAVTFTEADFQRLYMIHLRISGLTELTTRGGYVDSGHQGISRNAINSLLEPISKEISDLYCELNNLSGGCDREGNDLPNDGKKGGAK